MPPAEYYKDQYGWLGKLYYTLGFHNLYSSWWYLGLISLISISLVICSLDRFVPLYRALKKQKVTRHESYLKRQRLFGITHTKIDDETFKKIKEKLKAKHYSILEEDGNILAEKGRFSRWGPYVNHIGLIIFLLGGLLRFIPGMYIDDTLWIREGETKLVPETNGEYYLENKEFILEAYDKEKDKKFSEAIDSAGMVPKNYQSNVVLYKKSDDSIAGEEAELEKVTEYGLRVNEPLKFDGFALYQVSYKLDEFTSMSFTLMNKNSLEELGTIKIDLNEPKERYELGNGYAVEILSYFPDFEFDENSNPTTKSRVPNNPAFIFKMDTPDKPDGEISFVAIQQTIEPIREENKYKMAFTGIETKDVTGLTVRKDLTLGVFILGGFLFMFGVVQGSYWNHRRIWIQRRDNEVWIAAHTNKNWYGMKNDLNTILSETSIQIPEDQLIEKEVK